MRRRRLLALLVLACALFLIVSALLARAFSVDSAERSAITAVVKAEARGDAGAVRSRLSGCGESSACQAGVARDVAALRRPGAVSIIQIQASAGFSLGATTGTARVVWRVGSSLPIVQCVRVHRAGNVLSGLEVKLQALSRRITSDADCPSSF